MNTTWFMNFGGAAQTVMLWYFNGIHKKGSLGGYQSMLDIGANAVKSSRMSYA